ncbi:MAG TPA: tetraacyldisaccharide 4'-kinase [Candidatus Gastranaerophilales bacterium]|nr:tetraacyldisaccharide 4'-kinase [Candidatus Gastranaerophilales bacterium]
MKTYFSGIHYGKNLKIRDKLALIFLIPASYLYGFIIYIRNFLYDIKLIKSAKLPAYMISIGNLTTGGTGKTPITSFIANNIAVKTAVISRGYGGKLSNKNTNIISDGEKLFCSAEFAGDEPFWIAENSKGTVVITGKNRIKSAQYAIKNFNSQVLILDDGFQHRKLHRDLNILLIDSEKMFGNNFLLPAGPLREPLNQIKRADKVIIVNKNPYIKGSEEKIKKLQEVLKNKYSKESFICEFRTEKIYNIMTGQAIEQINKAAAFSGIAQPESFFSILEEKNINILQKKVFSDHYLYKIEDIKSLIEDAANLGADAIITTEKDSVKIRDLIKHAQIKMPVCALQLQVNIDIKSILGEQYIKQ